MALCENDNCRLNRDRIGNYPYHIGQNRKKFYQFLVVIDSLSEIFYLKTLNLD